MTDTPKNVLPAVAGRMERSNHEFELRCLRLLKEEQEKLSPDNALVACLCDAVRLAREYSDAMQGKTALDALAAELEKRKGGK